MFFKNSSGEVERNVREAKLLQTPTIVTAEGTSSFPLSTQKFLYKAELISTYLTDFFKAVRQDSNLSAIIF